MKKNIKIIIFTGICLFFSTSCLNEFLDESPEAGLTENEVFTKYENFINYFDFVYASTGGMFTACPLSWCMSGQKFSREILTDMCDLGRLTSATGFRMGHMFPYANILDGESRGWFYPMWRCIRVANTALLKINMVQNITEQDKNDILGQCYFVRAYCHFEAFKGWGGMPYLKRPLGPDDEWDLSRLPKDELCRLAAQDMDSAVYFFALAGKMRRDPGPGITGHLNDPYQYKPNGVAAKAIKARMLLYGASPLNDETGVISWEDAAIANWEAIQTALQYEYELLPFARYKENFNGTRYSNEQLFGWYAGSFRENTDFNRWIIPNVMRGSVTINTADCPTQNTIDKYETKWGEPLNTQADRDKAILANHYKDQDPYANRDPRFEFSVIYNQSTLTGWLSNKAQIYYQMVNGLPKYSELLNTTYPGNTETGYYQRKRWGGESVKNKVAVAYTEPIIRLAELYLNYAEAANEAYGPNTAAPGAAMTAVEAINHIRQRVNMPPVLAEFTGDKDIFRDRIKNERTIELAFEGHYFYDIRRWEDAPEIYSGTMWGMDIEKVTVSPTFPTGYRYTRKKLPDNRQIAWRADGAMYYFPLRQADYEMFKNFEKYPVW